MRGSAIVVGLGLLAALGMCGRSPRTTATADGDAASATVMAAVADDDRATVTAATAACRARPSAKAKVVVRLSRGARLDVRDRSDGWARVSPTGEECWVALAALDSEAADAPETRPTLYADPARAQAQSPTPRPSHSYSRRSRIRPLTSYGDGSCPCGSGHVCIGPRGGRYCITSGGNKRYGM